jgi:hypothetical protein
VLGEVPGPPPIRLFRNIDGGSATAVRCAIVWAAR